MFRLFADLIGQHLDAQERMTRSERALLDERETSKLRDQFIAVLGHDLRNPLSAIHSAAAVLRTMPQDPEAAEFLDMIDRSTARMGALINNVLDFARGRLGGGIQVGLREDPKLADALTQVITELQTSWPHRIIQMDIAIDRVVTCDSGRLGQLLSNLLANALTHGAADTPIKVVAKTGPADLKISVTNFGKTIPPEVIAFLFEPFVRGSARLGQQGLGLGLYISKDIAIAHHGELKVDSTDGVTRFMFRMPLTDHPPAVRTP